MFKFAPPSYDKIDDYAYGKVMFVTHSSVIALVLDKADVEGEDEDDEDAVSTSAKEEKAEKPSPKPKKAKQPIGFQAE